MFSKMQYFKVIAIGQLMQTWSGYLYHMVSCLFRCVKTRQDSMRL